MKPDNPAKHFIIAFLIAIAVYAIAYKGIEHRRNRNGPWQVTFTNAISGAPTMIINQTALGYTNVQITFPGHDNSETNSFRAVLFTIPRPVPFDVPFGKCIFMDLTFLPGTLTFRMFEHEIELLPRTMIIDHSEHSWHSHEEIVLK